MDGVRVQITGREESLAALGAIAARLEDATPMWAAIGMSLEASTQQRFLDEASPGGSRWPASLRAQLEGGRTLTDSARLMQSITSNATAGSVEVGTNVLYAAIHQFGGTIRARTEKGLRFKVGRGPSAKWARKQSVTIPPRPFLGIDDSDEAEILAIATDFIAGPEASDAA